MSSNNQFLAGPLAFMQQYPVVKLVNSSIAMPPPNPLTAAKKVENSRTVGNAAEGQGRVDTVQRVQYFNIAPMGDPLVTLTSPTCLTPSKFLIGGATIPLFHLPYNNNENHRITLTDKQHVGNVDFFITELVDGCSIYVEGTPQNPTVYHLNAIETPGFVPPVNATADQTYALKWASRFNHMDHRFNNDTIKPKRVIGNHPNLQPARKLENHHYMIRLGGDDQANFEALLPQYQANNTAPQSVLGASVDAMELLSTQGTVFGIRANGSWRFYVQARALVQYFHVAMIPNARAPLTTGQRALKFVGRYRPEMGPVTATPQRTNLGCQWIIRSVREFWPGNTEGAVA